MRVRPALRICKLDVDPQIRKAGDAALDGDAAPARLDGVDLVNARYGAELMTCGALLEGLRVWAKVEEWGGEELGLVSRTMDPYRLLNAVAEHHHGGFGHREDLGLAMFAAGAVLGMRAGQMAQFYDRAVTFLTRVIGCRYEDRLDRLDDIAVGRVGAGREVWPE